MTRIGAWFGVVAGMLFLPFAASGQEPYPSRPIEMIIPTPPGGGTDISLRLLARHAEKELGQRIVVINKGGASGGIGVTALVAAKPDGYTIAGVWFSPLTVVPHTLPFKYRPDDYVPVTLSMSVPFIYCVKESFPASNAREFVNELKANPDKYTYGADGIGGAQHLATERILRQWGARARVIPLSDSGGILTSFLGGQIDIYVGTIGNMVPYMKSREAKCLLLSSAQRSAAVPGVEGLADIGLADDATTVWRGIIAPKKTPPERVHILEQAFQNAAKTEEMRKFVEREGGQMIGGSAAEFRAVIERDYAAFGALVPALGVGLH